MKTRLISIYRAISLVISGLMLVIVEATFMASWFTNSEHLGTLTILYLCILIPLWILFYLELIRRKPEGRSIRGHNILPMIKKAPSVLKSGIFVQFGIFIVVLLLNMYYPSDVRVLLAGLSAVYYINWVATISCQKEIRNKRREEIEA